MKTAIDDLAILPATKEAWTLVYQDEFLLVVNKPAHLLTVPGRHPQNQDCLISRVQQEFLSAAVVHRLHRRQADGGARGAADGTRLALRPGRARVRRPRAGRARAMGRCAIGPAQCGDRRPDARPAVWRRVSGLVLGGERRRGGAGHRHNAHGGGHAGGGRR